MVESHAPPHTMRLKDGRTLAYAEYGTPGGHPVIHTHGSPGSRLELSLIDGIDAALTTHNLRVIAVDRPGMGYSDFQPGRQVVDYAQDIHELADGLGLDRFALVGLSAGTPFTLAAMHAFPQRITAAHIISGISAFDAPNAWQHAGSSGIYFRTAKIHPWLTRGMLWLSMRMRSDKAVEKQREALPARDWEIFAQPGMFQRLLDALFVEGCRKGTRGLAYEARLLWQPWGFDLRAIQMPVTLWHGTADRNAPLPMLEHNAGLLPNATVILKEDEGHFSLLVNHAAEIYGRLARDIDAATRAGETVSSTPANLPT